MDRGTAYAVTLGVPPYLTPSSFQSGPAMKITINVECTPEEARAFMGLPDVAPFQTAMLDEMKARMQKVATAMEPETVMKMLFPLQSEGMAEMQKAFWGQFSGKAEK